MRHVRRSTITLAILLFTATIAAAQSKMDVETAAKTRYEGAVAAWYGSHFEDSIAHDWDPIREWNGPFHPILGEYRTNDRNVIKKHLQWMRRAGIDVIFYDLCRIQPELTILDLPKQKTLQIMCEELAHQEKETRKLKLVIWMEKWNDNPTVEQYRFGLDYVRKNFADKDYYFRFEGKPLVMTYLNRPAPEFDKAESDFAKDITVRRITPTKNSAGWRYLGPGGNAECMTANPGIDGYMEHAFITKVIRNKPIDVEQLRKHGKEVIAKRANGKYFEDHLLQARQGNPKVIFISGWNDWAYCLQMEPAKEYGFLYVDLAARLLGREKETAPYRVEP